MGWAAERQHLQVFLGRVGGLYEQPMVSTLFWNPHPRSGHVPLMITKHLRYMGINRTIPSVKGDPGAYFFPTKGREDFEWHKQSSYQHANAAVLKCATALGLVQNAEHAKTFTTQSIRIGLAEEYTRNLRSALALGNPMVGRSRINGVGPVRFCSCSYNSV